jgi:hypothetical protein
VINGRNLYPIGGSNFEIMISNIKIDSIAEGDPKEPTLPCHNHQPNYVGKAREKLPQLNKKLDVQISQSYLI